MSRTDNSQFSGHQSTQNSVQTGITISSQAAHRRKYHGLLKRSPLKNMRDNLFRFIDYINTRSLSHRSIIEITKIVTFIQLFILSLLPYERDYWVQNNIIGRLLNVASVIGFISPAQIDQDIHLVIALVVELIVLAFELTFLFAFLYFLRMSKCSIGLVNFIAVLMCSLLLYLITMFGSYAGRAVYGIASNDGTLALNIVSLILSVFHIVLLSCAQTFFVTPMIMLRPQSFHLLFSQTVFIFIASHVYYGFLSTLGGLTYGKIGNALCFCSCIASFPIFYIFFFQVYCLGNVKIIFDSSHFYLCTFFNPIVIAAQAMTGIHCADYSLLIYAGIFLICFIGAKLFFTRFFSNITKYVKDIQNDASLFETFSKSTAIAIARIAFEVGFPLAHNWHLFKELIEKYPNDAKISLIFVRYAAIYPDETPTLHLAGRHLMNMKHGSLEIKHCIFQLHSILQQRESSMSVSIKKSLGKTKQKVEKARGQIRYLWECIMRGNVQEIEGLSTRLKDLEEEINRDYSQLCLVYPNNPYVANAYSSFLREIANDEAAASEFANIYHMLRLGKRIREERCLFYASKHFPNLPTEVQHEALKRGTDEKAIGSDVKVVEHSAHEMPSASIQQSSFADAFDPNQQAINEEKLQKRYIESMVESVQVPSMKYGPILIVFFFIIVMPVCIIPITVSVVNDIDMVRDSMKIVMYSSQLRLSLAEMILLTYQTVFHNTNVTRMISLQERWTRAYGNTKPLPDNWSTDTEALLQSVQDNKELVAQMNSMTNSLAKSEYFDPALSILYTPSVPFSIYTTHNDFTTENRSLEYIITYLISSAVNSADTTDPIQYLDEFEFWTTIKNIKEMLPHFEEFANLIVSGINTLTRNSRNNVLQNVLLAVLIPYIVSMCVLIFLIAKLEKEKKMIFNVFKALPKSTLSSIVNQLNNKKTVHQNDDDEDSDQNNIAMSAQEENALRVLSTSVETNKGHLERLWPIFLVMVIFTAAIIVLCVVVIYYAYEISEKFGLINPLFGAIPYVQSQFSAIALDILRLSAAAEFENCPAEGCPLTDNAKANYTLVNADLEDLLADVVNALNLVRLGTEELNSSGLAIGGEEIITLLTKDMCQVDDDVVEYSDVINCLSYESGIAILWRKIRQMHLASTLMRSDLSFDMDSHNIIMTWLLGVAKPDYVDKSLELLDSTVTTIRDQTVNESIIITAAVCLVVIVLCGIFLSPHFIKQADVAKWSLRMLLFCQPNIILQTKTIVKILSNDFSNKEESKDQTGASFYETVVSNLLDGVIFMNNQLEILSTNSAVGSILGIEDLPSIIGKKLNEVIVPGKDSSTLNAFYAALQGALKAQRSPSIELEAEIDRDGDSISLLLSITAVSTDGNVQLKAVNAEGLSAIALVMKDITSSVASQKLLVEEGIKSEKLLLMILPPIIVNKLQNGEKNISFAVKSASIMFVDIVSFTPWCGSNTAAYVMKTLNRLFAEFDRILKKYDRMTKIKCIGDCYMCAGGIFDEVNQPAEHAKQAVSFGIDIISALKLLNIELNEKLRIRVGVNTGGPIVAGVLGIEKPTFDILGPDICLAAMMEHHGVPMHVHIPQHCYDLIYGTYFRIKERGDVEVKGKMYHTYIVSGYDQTDNLT